jgi:serine/threonine protein kinase
LSLLSGAFRGADLVRALAQPHDGRSSDVWALGVMIYALVVGFRPFLDCKAVVQVRTLSAEPRARMRECSSSCGVAADCRDAQGNYVSLDEVARAPDGVDTTPGSSDAFPLVAPAWGVIEMLTVLVAGGGGAYAIDQSSETCSSGSSRPTRASVSPSTASWPTHGPAFELSTHARTPTTHTHTH